ncbi:family 43 glycosylhydrolase [Lachnospiraceae bacterium OttesenSCG-928-D06]|nr:family 43 glycosylhydrolase [Lachnospiraceae bacterium OttesenSCG-928-D06]
MQNAIYPGKVWMDTQGKPIQAHGGAVFYEKGVFYWYGENKEFTDGENGIWTYGIKYYSSKDLYNWTDEGFLIPPSEDEDCLLHPKWRVDRPHIIYCAMTKTYVCWIKISGPEACFVLARADEFAGPYEIVREHYRPLGKKVGDFDLVWDDETGEAWVLFDGDHEGIYGLRLTEDYLDVTGEAVVSFGGLHPPFCREAPAHFKRNDIHYLLTSGMSGYVPNPSQTGVSKSPQGPYILQGDPHINDISRASFNSQISFVFRHPEKKDLYIALADRWVPDFVVNEKRSLAMERTIASRFYSEYTATEEERSIFMQRPALPHVATRKAGYIWLPLRFEGDMVCIDWLDEWRMEDYEAKTMEMNSI